MAHSYLKMRMNQRANEALDTATEDEREKAQEWALAYLKSLPYRGEPSEPGKGYLFPRNNLILDDGTKVEGIPQIFADLFNVLQGFYLKRDLYAYEELQIVFAEMRPLLDKEVAFPPSP